MVPTPKPQPAGKERGRRLSEDLIAALRADWTAEQRYMNFGTFGPSTRTTLAAEQAARRAMNADFAGFFDEHLRGPLCRERMTEVAVLLGTDVDEIAWISGTTEGLNLAARGLRLEPGAEVLTTDAEHPAAVYPWLLRARREDLSVRQLPFPTGDVRPEDIVEMFAAALRPTTRVLTFCHVNYSDGAVLPVAEICAMARARGVLTVVDGAQAVGHLEFKLAELGCDIYVTSLHKWTAGIYGSGVLYVRRKLLDEVTPLMVEMPDGWSDTTRFGTPAPPDSIDFRRGWPEAMRRYATLYHYAGPTLLGTLTAIEQLSSIGLPRVAARVRALGKRLRAGLADIEGVKLLTPPRLAAGITAFRLNRVDPVALYRWLRTEHNIMTRVVDHSAVGFVANRACTHIFNEEADVDALVAAVAAAAAAGLTGSPPPAA
jgi:selenocysteine lyase/cysteine desulfurase